MLQAHSVDGATFAVLCLYTVIDLYNTIVRYAAIVALYHHDIQ